MGCWGNCGLNAGRAAGWIFVRRRFHYKRPSLGLKYGIGRRFERPGVRFITRRPFLLFLQNLLYSSLAKLILNSQFSIKKKLRRLRSLSTGGWWFWLLFNEKKFLFLKKTIISLAGRGIDYRPVPDGDHWRGKITRKPWWLFTEFIVKANLTPMYESPMGLL